MTAHISRGILVYSTILIFFLLSNILFKMAATEKRPEIIDLARGLAGVPLCEDYERMISGMMYVSFTIYLHPYEMVY